MSPKRRTSSERNMRNTLIKLDISPQRNMRNTLIKLDISPQKRRNSTNFGRKLGEP
jgi:hypothetical protein